MNISEDQIEQSLKRAPQPRPHPSLRDRLVADIALPTDACSPSARAPVGSWWRRWWPAVTAGGLAAVAFAVVIVQQTQISDLEQTIERLEHELTPAPAESGPAPQTAPSDGVTVPLPDGPAELEELRARIRDLSEEVKAMEAMQAENAQLKTEAAAALGIPPEMLQELEEAKARAQRIACVNNLKQLGLAARIWATDNGDLFPPDLVSMSNEISMPKVLVCPADSTRQPASDWASFSTANSSYEFLAANGSVAEPQRVAFRCPIHGNVGLADGSVQQRVAQDHPDWLIMRDGKLMLEAPAQPASPTAANSGQAPQMSEEMLRRYGLLPAPPAGQPLQMSEELMRRYGLLPAASDSAQPATEPSPAPEDQP
jgi:hypothetical protein